MTEAEWLACDDPQRMLDYLKAMKSAVGVGESPYPVPNVSDRKLRLFACACVRQVWPLLTDKRSRNAVEVAERFADGLATEDELGAAWDAARDAAWDAARDAARATAWAAARDAARDAAWAAARAAARDAAWAKQAGLLRDIVGNPFRPMVVGNIIIDGIKKGKGKDPNTIWIERDWLTPQVLSLAHAAYEERLPDGFLDPARLAVLSDALEEAGCDCEELLRHLRGFCVCPSCMLPTPAEAEYGGGVYWCPDCGGTEGSNQDAYWAHSPGPHVRGCWALDLVLGKE